MALTRPTLLPITAFDATNSQDFVFSVVGGDQTVAAQLTIINQGTSEIVYQHKYTTYGVRLEVPANTLTNGNYYLAYVVTYNAQDTASVSSPPIQFWCYTQPTFTLSNFPLSEIINNSSFNFELTYNQDEGELLNSYKFNLYDTQGFLIDTSGLLYVGNITTLPLVLNYTFAGLTDNTIYRIQVDGTTAEGTSISTLMLSFSVTYTTPSALAAVNLINNCAGGYITLSSHTIFINGLSNPTPPIYVDNNTAVDVSNPNYYVEWNTNYQIAGDFTARLWGYDLNIDSTIIRFNDTNNNTIIVKYRIDPNDETKVYVDCTAQSNGMPSYYCYSNSITEPLSTDNLLIWLKRHNNVYEITLYNLE